MSSTEIEPPTTEATGEEAREAENGTDPETRDTLPGFGSAHMFMPIPNSGTVVAAHCNWQFRYNYVENRIPRKYLTASEGEGFHLFVVKLMSISRNKFVLLQIQCKE